MQKSNTCGELSLADLSALVPKPVLLCAKDRANLCQRARNCGGVTALAQRLVQANSGIANVGAGLRAISCQQDSSASLAPNGPTRGTKWPGWVDSALNSAFRFPLCGGRLEGVELRGSTLS